MRDSRLANEAGRALQGKDLEDGSVSNTLASYSIEPTKFEHFLEVRAIATEEAKLLETTPDRQVFVDWSVERDDGNNLAQTVGTIWNGTRMRFRYATEPCRAAERRDYGKQPKVGIHASNAAIADEVATPRSRLCASGGLPTDSESVERHQ